MRGYQCAMAPLMQCAGGRTAVALFVAIATIAAGTPAFADPVEQTAMQTESFGFPLSPGSQAVSFAQFDAMGGARQLQEVTLAADGIVGAEVTIENDSVLPAPDLGINITGILTVEFGPLAPFAFCTETFISDGSVTASDGVPGSGTDFWDFGFISCALTAGATTSTGLAPFIGGGTVDAIVNGSGAFAGAGSTDVTITVDDFAASGTLQITYGFKFIDGACCFPDGMCSSETIADCAAAGGVYQGPDTTCAPNPCEQPGACCLPGGGCQELIVRLCNLAGGEHQGAGTSCMSGVCPEPGACCLPNGTCVQVTGASPGSGVGAARLTAAAGSSKCEALGGIYQGDGTSCPNVRCPQPEGACCFDDGSCTVLTQAACRAAGGGWQGMNVSCVDADCPQPLGACCFENGTCGVFSGPTCVALGGTYQGNGTVCADVDCPQPDGACCRPDGSCVQLQKIPCNLQGGAWQGPLTVCADVTCPQPNGACCFPDGSCGVFPQAACKAAGGIYQGDFLICADVNCPPPPGACCLDDGTCQELPADACAIAGGDYQGDGSTCAGADCPALGACCLSSDTCLDVLELACIALGGDYKGDGTSCADPGICEVGACCLNDETCIETDLTSCLLMGGYFAGIDTQCASIVCPQCEDFTRVVWDLDDCDYPLDDYSEFVPEIFGDCADLAASNFFREQGVHSCVEDRFGNGNAAVCSDFPEVNEFIADSPSAFRVQVTVTAVGVPAQFRELTFWQLARIGLVGGGFVNDPPQFYGIRVTRDGVEVDRRIDQPTANNWTQEMFLFSGPSFVVPAGTSATFEVEFFPYGYEGGELVQVWDIDDIEIKVRCCTP